MVRYFNLNTQVLDFPHTARNLECCDFGPRVGLAYRLGDSWVIRSGYGMVWFEQTGITTPFTLPQFPFVQTVGQQSPGQHQRGVCTLERSNRAGDGAESELRPRARRFWSGPECGFGLFAAMEFHRAKDASAAI